MRYEEYIRFSFFPLYLTGKDLIEEVTRAKMKTGDAMSPGGEGKPSEQMQKASMWNSGHLEGHKIHTISKILLQNVFLFLCSMFASKNVYVAHVHSTDRDREPSGSGVTDG